VSWCEKALALKIPAKGLSDGNDPIRQHRVQGRVLAMTSKMQRLWRCPHGASEIATFYG